MLQNSTFFTYKQIKLYFFFCLLEIVLFKVGFVLDIDGSLGEKF